MFDIPKWLFRTVPEPTISQIMGTLKEEADTARASMRRPSSRPMPRWLEPVAMEIAVITIFCIDGWAFSIAASPIVGFFIGTGMFVGLTLALVWAFELRPFAWLKALLEEFRQQWWGLP
jgi:hypothetical protein